MMINMTQPSPSLIESARIAGDLQPIPINGSWIIEGTPTARGRAISRSLDGQVWTVVWECTEGRFNWHYGYDETVLILEGSIVLESEHLPPTRYRAGDLILFRKGAHARWHVEGYVKKLALCHATLPSAVSFSIQALRSLKRKLQTISAAVKGVQAS